jgi:hypothetical protein
LVVALFAAAVAASDACVLEIYLLSHKYIIFFLPTTTTSKTFMISKSQRDNEKKPAY